MLLPQVVLPQVGLDGTHLRETAAVIEWDGMHAPRKVGEAAEQQNDRPENSEGRVRSEAP